MKKLKIIILSWLVHHANRESKNDYFYRIKNRLLTKYGRFIGYDVQFIEGKKCNSCGGTGEHYRYGRYGQVYDYDDCYHCFGGWYKQPHWNILSRIQFGKYVFHQPKERVYKKPDQLSLSIIEGYIDHNRSKHGKFALFVLFLIYEKNYLNRWYKETGNGWRCYWWYPRNYLYNLIHFIKKGKNAYPIKRMFEKRIKYPETKPYQYQSGDELPF